MQLHEAIALIQHRSFSSTKPVKWADLGCGTGMFTRALASLLPAGSIIYAVDTDQVSLASITDFNDVSIQTIRQDFVQDDWPFDDLDGILMANSLHYVKNQLTFLEKANRHLAEPGCLLLIEYDTDTPNPWVPYPLSYNSLRQLCQTAGYSSIEKIGEKSSLYGRSKLYSTHITR